MTRPDEPLAPARRARQAPAPVAPTSDYDDAEVARGQAAAVLGALGRMQLTLDVMAREHADALARITEVLEDLESRLPSTGTAPSP